MDSAGVISYLVRRAGGKGLNCLEVNELCTVKNSIYGYKPSIAWNSLFLALFAASSLIHLGQGIKYKTWSFLIAMVVGGLAEAVGKHHSPRQLYDER
jgi:hypothetical protein